MLFIGLAVAVGFVATVLALLIMYLGVLIGDQPHPTDAEMLAQFGQHRSELETIVGMLQADPQVQHLAPDFTYPDPAPISKQRLADYRKRLAAAGIGHGVSRYGDHVTFLVSARGLSIAGSSKSFAYAEGPEHDSVVTDGDLDAAAARSPEANMMFARHIEGNWWLQLNRR